MGQLVTVAGVEARDVADAVGEGTYAKGVQYAQERAVLSMEWDDDESVLSGLVQGHRRRLYTTSVSFVPTPDGHLEYEMGDCSCPVGIDCKHAAALAVTASAGTSSSSRAAAHHRPAWEQSLGSLLDPGSGGTRGHGGRSPLAIELTLSGRRHAGADPQLLARLVQRGKTGWISGRLSWSTLSTLLGDRSYHAEHVRLLRELYALHRAPSDPWYGYPSGGEKTIDLAAFESRQLWALLDEAAALGLPLVHAGKCSGAVEPYRHAELCLDATAGGQPEGALTVRPVLHVDGAATAAVPVRFIGSAGHGVVYRMRPGAPVDHVGEDPAAEPPFRWARLARPVPPAMQRIALADERLDIPADARVRFRDEFYPRLRHQATIVSSDGSFTPPTISGPTLVLRAVYGAGHDLDLTWEWAYAVGESAVRTPLDPANAGDGYRDVAAESALLDALDVPVGRGAPRTDPPERRLTPQARLSGLDTMRFTTEVLPLLSAAPGVLVEASGEPADFREVGDTLRIGVAADASGSETDWFDLAVTIAVEGREVPFTDVFRALATDETHLLLPDGGFFSLEKPELAALRRLIEEARALQDAPEGPLRISRFQAGLWDELTEIGVVDREAAAWREQVSGLLALDSVPPAEPPSTLAATLRPYQRDGFAWLAFLWEHRLGGILADDMGLGKTLQSLALVGHARQAQPAAPPFLVVAPTSVVANWTAEAARFAPGLTVVAITDTLRRHGQDLAEIVGDTDIVVTSYTLLRLDIASYEAMAWSGLVLDEAQHVKNHRSKVYQCARRVSAPFKLAITGTPMENNLMELWSLLSITAPGLFPNATRFRDHFARPIERQGEAERLAALRRRIRPLMRRRTKELVATDLPAKQEQVLEVELEPRHRTIYQRQLQRERQRILGLIDDVDRHRFTILRSLTLLRQLSLHAGLVSDDHRDVPSSKIDGLVEQLVAVIEGGHRTLVFSQFTGFLAEIRRHLEVAGIAYEYLDGTTRRRAAVVQRFKDGAAPVFLISLKAGGFGLNLTEADYCFVLDPWWNPATEAQAVDRAHRIGQTRPVMVYRLIAKGTIEEKVMALKAKKAELFSGVMDAGDAFSSALEADDIRALLE